MRVLLVGGGGREHALATAIARSPTLTSLTVTAANPGWPDGTRVHPAATVHDIVAVTRDVGADLVVVGPEAPLADGLVDALDIPCFGPTAAAARLESSKSFAKEIMAEAGVPTAEALVVDADGPRARERADRGHVVVKVDGLAAGKGVFVCPTSEQAHAALDEVFGDRFSAGRAVLEELLVGPEVSVFGLSDGHRVVPLLSAQDHKRLGEGDTGENTGGMGAIAPCPLIDAEAAAEVVQHPTYSFDIKGRRDLALTQIRRQNQDLGHLRLEDPGSYVIFTNNEKGAIVAEVTVDKDAEIALSEGDYFVRRRYSGSLYESKVPIKEDHTTTVKESDMKTVPMGRVARKGGDDYQGAAWSLLAGGGVAGEVLPQTSLVTQGSLGLGVDLQPVTLQLRARYGQSVGGQNTVVKSDIIGGDLSVMMGVDVGRLYLGAGLRGGGDVFIQSFPDQELEEKRSSGARMSAVGNVSVAVTAWMSIFAEPALDAYLIRVADEFGDGDEQQIQLSPSVIGGLQIYL